MFSRPALATGLQVYIPPRTLQSAGAGQILVVPISQRAVGCRTFASEAPRLWNELAAVIRPAETKANIRGVQ